MFKRSIISIWRATIRIFAFVSKETLTILHQPRLIFSLILGPFLILLLFGIGYTNEPRTLETLFVIPEGSKVQKFVEKYTDSLGDRIQFAGITQSAEEADKRLRQRDVDVVVVTPFDPMQDWQEDRQSTFSVYHNEIDPIEETYIRILGQRYAEEINDEILATAISQSQQEARNWNDDIAQAKDQASLVRQALAAGDQARAQSSAQDLKQDIDLLALGLGSGLYMISGLDETMGTTNVGPQLTEKLKSLQNNSSALVEETKNNQSLSDGQESAAEVEDTLTEIDSLMTEFEEIEPAIMVAPFRSESLSITKIQIQPMHFYVPGVIALLLQHLAITLAGLSIVREKLSGAMELFRAGPVNAFEILLGKYGSYLLIIGLLAAILTALVVLALQVPQLGTWFSYSLIILALLLASLGVGFNISLSAKSNSQAIQYGMLTLLAAIFFCGFFLPLYRIALPVRLVSWLLPATYGTILLQDVMLRGQPPQVILLVGLFVFAAFFFALAWFRLSRQMARE